MENMNKELQVTEIGHPKLPDDVLLDLATRIKNEYGIKVKNIVDTEKGYEFKGEYDFTIAELEYNKESHKFDPLFFHKEIYRLISNKEKKEKNKQTRKYVVARNKAIFGLTASAIIVLTSLGVIKSVNATKENEAIETQLDNNKTANISGKTISNGTDVELIEWANYVVENIPDEYDIYTNFYAPLMSSYYTYLDYLDSGLPTDTISDKINEKHNEFRNKAIGLNEYLQDVNLANYKFENSPFYSAIITDGNKNVLKMNGTRQGEVNEDTGKVITYDDKEQYQIYININTLPDNNYDMNNLPEDALIHEGKIYLNSSCLKETKEKTY